MSIHIRLFAASLMLALGAPVAAQHPVEPHHRLVPQGADDRRVALTLDACSGRLDADLLEFLIRERIPATFFVTARWIRRNPQGVARIKAHAELFQVEDHGENHIPAVIGADRQVYGIRGVPDLAHLQREVRGGAQAIEQAFSVTPRWYRGATAEYDPQAMTEIEGMGYRIAGFSVNADAGATLPQAEVEARLRRVRGGDVIIAHMNKPASGTGRALSVVLPELRQQGYVFVRFDQADLQPVPRAVRPRVRQPSSP